MKWLLLILLVFLALIGLLSILRDALAGLLGGPGRGDRRR